MTLISNTNGNTQQKFALKNCRNGYKTFIYMTHMYMYLFISRISNNIPHLLRPCQASCPFTFNVQLHEGWSSIPSDL